MRIRLQNLILILLLFSLFAPVPVGARRVRDVNYSPFDLLDFGEIVKLVEDLEPAYRQLALLWEEKVGQNKRIEKLSFLIEVLNLVKDSMIFDEQIFRTRYPSIWEEIGIVKSSIEENPDRKDEVISYLLWKGLDKEEQRMFMVIATSLRFSHEQLLYNYIKEINNHFLLHFIIKPFDQFLIKDFITEELRKIGISYEYYLKRWLPEVSKKIVGFIDKGEILPEEAWDEYVNFVKRLPPFLGLLKIKKLYTDALAGKIFEINLRLANTPEEIELNFLSVEKIIQKLPEGSLPSLLSYILDNSFNLSEGLSINYQSNNKTTATIIDRLDQADVFSQILVKNLLNSATKSSQDKFNIYITNLNKILEFIESVIPFRYSLNEKGKRIEDILNNEILQIAEESGNDYLKFRGSLLKLQFDLTGLEEFRKDEIKRIQMMVDALKRIEDEFAVEKIDSSNGLIQVLKDIIGSLRNKNEPRGLEEILNEYVNGNLSLSRALDFSIHTKVGDFNLHKTDYESGLVSLKLTLLHILGEINIDDFPEDGIRPENVYKLLEDFYKEKGLIFTNISTDLQSWISWDYYFKHEVLLNPDQHKGDYFFYIFIKSLLEQGKIKDSNLGHYYSLLTEEERELLAVHKINLKVETIDRYLDLITEKTVDDAIDELIVEHMKPNIDYLAMKFGVSNEVLIGLSHINNINLNEKLDFPEIGELIYAQRPLSEKEIKYFLSLVNINGLYLDEIMKRFFILDGLGKIRTINMDALDSFIYGEEFRKMGDLVFSPEGFKSFIKDIHDTSDWVEMSFRILGSSQYEKYGIRPEEVGRYGEIIAISRRIFRLSEGKRIPLSNPLDSEYKWRQREHVAPLILGKLFISGVERVDGDYRIEDRAISYFRVIDNKGNIIAELETNKRVVKAVYFRNEYDTGWGKWDVDNFRFTDEFLDGSYFGEFLNNIVKSCSFIIKGK